MPQFSPWFPLRTGPFHSEDVRFLRCLGIEVSPRRKRRPVKAQNARRARRRKYCNIVRDFGSSYLSSCRKARLQAVRRAYHLSKEVEHYLGENFDQPKTPKPVMAQPCRWVVDSGSGFDLVGRRMLPFMGRSEVRDCERSLILSTANGEIRADKEAVIEIDKLGMKTTAIVLDDCPSVLSLGKKCMEEGFGFHWEPYGKPTLVLPSGKTISLQVEHYVPVLAVNEALPAEGDLGSGGKSGTAGCLEMLLLPPQCFVQDPRRQDPLRASIRRTISRSHCSLRCSCFLQASGDRIVGHHEVCRETTTGHLHWVLPELRR